MFDDEIKVARTALSTFLLLSGVVNPGWPGWSAAVSFLYFDTLASREPVHYQGRTSLAGPTKNGQTARGCHRSLSLWVKGNWLKYQNCYIF